MKRQQEDLIAREKTLTDILASLRSGYNPNYQDMAVLEAVRGYEYYAGLPSINDRDRKDDDEGSSDKSDEVSKEEEEEEELEEGEWTKEQLDKELGPMLYSDYESLLLEHEQMFGSETTQSICTSLYGLLSLMLTVLQVFDIESYIPDTLLPQYEVWRDYIVSTLELLGIARGVDEPSTGKLLRSAHKPLVFIDTP